MSVGARAAGDGRAEVDVLVAEDVWGPAFDELAGTLSVDYQPQLWADPERLREQVGRCRALVVRNRTKVGADVLAAAPHLRVVGRAGVGLDNIDLAAADEAGIVVVAALGANAVSVAEHTLGLALALARNIAGHDRALRRGEWVRSPGFELAGRTWGLLGAGATGRAVGRLASCLGMRVIGYDAQLRADDPQLREARIELVPLEQLVERSDVLSLHVPATAQTRGLVDRAFLRRMRPGSLLINVGRGEVVDEPALVEALSAGTIGGAALDVRAHEPPMPGTLETLDNVVLTPHIAGITEQSQERILRILARDLAALLAGGEALHAVGVVQRAGAARPAGAGA